MKNKKLFIIIAVIAIVILVATITIAVVLKQKGKTQEVVNSQNVIENVVDNTTQENEISNEIQKNEQVEENKVEEPTQAEPPAQATTTTTTQSSSPYYIKVNYQANTVTVYKKEANGEKTPIKAMICSCGGATPTGGVYKTSNKYEWGALIGGVYGRYSTRIVSDILFHSVPYTQNGNKGSIEYWEYDKLGTTASAGCVRLTLADAKWIFYNCPSGTEVEFYANSNPGPLGKPTAQKISDNTECRGWDPTDTAPESPWIAWNKKKAEQEKQKQEEKKKQEQAKNETIKNTTTKNEITNNTVQSNTTQANKVETNTVQTNTVPTQANKVENSTVQNKVTQGNTVTNNKVQNTVNTVTENKITNTNK